MNFLAILIERRRICQRWIEAVEMPVLTAVVARDDCALALRGLVACVAEDKVALAVAQLVVVWLLIRITWSTPVKWRE